ncbi:MAG: hypothetical protein QM626_12715 [Microbacterium sp.]|uniref:hypothetical protein n=1 Tax=Microbacterium sp. TaxID=51671 RepID=UPI0039E446AC
MFALLTRRRHADLSREHAASRITAYVYGTIVALAAVIPLGRENAESGLSFAIVLGASLTTYVAHVIAESAGLRARSDERLGRAELWGELRDSLPVLTSGLIPAAILGLAWLGDIPGLWAQLVAEGYIVVRLAITGFVIERIRGRRPSFRTFLAGMLLAAIGLVVSVLKVVVGGH